jgi:serine protease Do
MKNIRLIVLAALLVVVIGLATYVVGTPGATAALTGLLPGHSAVAEAAPVRIAAAAAPRAIATGDLQQTLEQVYEQVSPSVVNIQVRVNATGNSQGTVPQMPGMPFNFGPFNFGPNGPELPNNPQSPSTPQFATGLGSGFVWDKQGDIVTNNHVVDGAEDITVTFADGTTLKATLVGRDPNSDLAVIKVDPSKVALQPITVGDSTNLKVGQFTVAIGNPFGLENSMTFGIISALGRDIPANGQSTSMAPTYTIPDVIQTDAPVNPGNSGGVLLDLEGNFIGVPSQIESPVRASAGIGFAIPSAIVNKVVPVLIDKGSYQYPWIGISGTTLTPDLATAMGLSDTQRGALVMTVSQNGPAEAAGLVGSSKDVTINGQTVQVGGDVIVGIDGQPVNKFEDLVTYLARSGEVGKKVELSLLRNGQSMTVTLLLAARPAEIPGANAQPQQQPQQQQPQQQPEQPQQPQQPEQPQATRPNTSQVWMGIMGMTVTPELAQAMNVSADQKGVLIESVASGSPADKAGLQGGFKTTTLNGQQVMLGGDIITQAGGKDVASIEQLVGIVGGMQAGDTLNLSVLRNGKTVDVAVTLAARPASQQ